MTDTPGEGGPGGVGEELCVELAEGLRLDVKKHLIDRGLSVLGMRGAGSHILAAS